MCNLCACVFFYVLETMTIEYNNGGNKCVREADIEVNITADICWSWNYVKVLAVYIVFV